ncbi:MAG TPA: POTRA domain-containing protein [Polyangiaceae bacterium]|nr:POTRA domain-containing protein [Polyangiaceae bacterium]
MRLRPLLLGALVTAAPGTARGQTPAPTVTPITPAPRTEATAQSPTIDVAPDLRALEGKPVTRVAAVLEGNVWDDVQPPPIPSLKVGDAFSAPAARRALEALLHTGRYGRGRVTAQAEGPGVYVAVHLAPRKLIGRLELELHGAPVDRDELLRTADLAEDGEIVGSDVGAVCRAIERYLALHGFPSARATLSMRDTDDPTRTLVTVDVQPGPPLLIDGRFFYVFGAKPQDVQPTAGGYALNVKDRADGPALDQADVQLTQALRVKGWYRAEVAHDLVRVAMPPAHAQTLLRVRIDTGPLEIARFEGNEHYDDGVLGGALGIDEEPDRSPLHLADKIRLFYEKRGFLDAQVHVETRGGDKDPTQVLVFHVDEGKRVRVTSRAYPCLKVDVIKRLRQGGPTSAGDIGTEIDSFLDEELPGADLLVNPDPRGVSATIGAGAGQVATGARPAPLDLHPSSTYAADTYERAALHVQELYRNEGFLHAQVGPVQIVRARCDPRSGPRGCVPLPLPRLPPDVCTYDTAGLPQPVEPLDPSLSCRPDPSKGVECAPTLDVLIPIKLGPQTRLWDVAFTGVKSASEEDIADAAQIPLGDPVNSTKLEDARRRIVDWYKEVGYYYVDVKYTLEPSPDNTRARVRFEVTEGEQVIVRDIVVRGLNLTSEGVVRRRIALRVGDPYRSSDIRKTQERIATLGVFSSVNVSLKDPYVPQGSKTVIIEVVERTPQYVDQIIGFSTGEGFRGGIEYGHRNLLGYAWGLTLHAQASYLPDALILDPGLAANYSKLSTAERIATRDTVTMAWPEMGLGPTIRSQLDGIYVRDLERDFTLFKASALGTLIWRPVRQVQISGGPDYEHNDVHLFQDNQTIQAYLSSNSTNLDLQRLLRVPDGDSNVVAARVVVTWDRRDSAFNAHSGTYVAAGVEEVNTYPVQGTTFFPQNQFEGHFLRLTQTLAAYLPITQRISLATEVRLGEIVNVAKCVTPFVASTPTPYCTYPDRLFFMGGVDSMRGWLQDTFVPQEYADQIADGRGFTINSVPLRGGNLMINPRLELRFPVRAPFAAALFSDFGNLWNDPNYIFQRRLSLRADVGAGIRVETPVGPLVFDYGVNVTRRSYEDFGAFHFAIGLF